MSRSSKKPVRIIDHEPLDRFGANVEAPIFGKRGHASTNPNSPHPSRPYASNGISEYFINRVNEQQAKNSEVLNRSAIRDTEAVRDDDEERMDVPWASLAAVAALAFAIPLGLIYFTENMTGTAIDPITTASLRTADGLEVRDVSMTRLLKNGTFVVTINGRIANLSSKSKSLMPLTISLLDDQGREVQSWRHRIGKSSLDPSSTLRFMTSAIDFSGTAKTAHVKASTVKPGN